MPINLSALDAMVTAGATAEMIVAAVRAMSADDQHKAVKKRQRNAERMRSARALHSDAQRCTAMHAPPPSSPLSNPLSSSPQQNGGGGDRARETRFEISPEALAFATEMAVICGHDPEFLPPQWVGAGPAVRVQMMLDGGWRVDVMRDAAKATMRKKRDGGPLTIRYFEKIFARAHAPQLPLPVVQVVHPTAEVVHVHQSEFRSRARAGESLAARSLRLARSSSEA